MHIWLAFTAEQRPRLDIPLVELERQVREASANRIAVTGGRIGISSDLPMLVTDANDLRTYYEDPSVGVSYETDAASTASTGARRGRNPPAQPATPEGGTTPNSTPTPGDETTPSPGDDDQPPNSVP